MEKEKRKKNNRTKNKRQSNNSKFKNNKPNNRIYSHKKSKRRTATSLKKKKAIKRRKRQKLIKEISVAVLLGILLSLLIGYFFVSVVDVKGYSMSPTFRDGDKVVINKTSNIKRFDLIAFSSGNKTGQIRRVIGLPGEKIEYKHDTLYINDKEVDEKFLVDEINESQENGKDYTEDFSSIELTSSSKLPEGYYLVLGDNRPYSTDSRYYGIISEKTIIGKVVMQLFPINDMRMF